MRNKLKESQISAEVLMQKQCSFSELVQKIQKKEEESRILSAKLDTVNTQVRSVLEVEWCFIMLFLPKI